MADRPTITTVPSGAVYDTDTLNTNFTALRDMFDRVLGRAGTGGVNNVMQGDLDMGGNRIRNTTITDVISGGTEVVGTISALRDIKSTTNAFVIVLGYYSAGDGGGGIYRYDGGDSTSPDNSGTVIVDQVGNRWKLVTQGGPISVLQFGVRGDGVTDDSAAFQNAIDEVDQLFIPTGVRILLESPVTIGDNKHLYGPGTIIKSALTKWAVHIVGDNVKINGVVFNPQNTSGQPNWDIKLGDGIQFPTIENCIFDSGAGVTYAAIGCSWNSNYMYHVSDGAVDTVADTITNRAASSSGALIGQGLPVKIIPIDSNAVAPGGLSFNTVYYSITSDNLTYSFALTEEDANNGVKIDITSTGSGRGMIVSVESDYPYNAPIEGLKIHNNLFRGYAYHCYMFFIRNFSISDNRFEGCTGDSIRIREGCGNGEIVSNVFKNIGNINGSGSRDCIDTAWSGYELLINGNVADTVASCFVDLKGGEKISGVEGYATRHVTVTDNIATKVYFNSVTWGAGAEFGGGTDETLINGTIGYNTFTENVYHNATGAGSAAQPAIHIKAGARYVDISHNKIFVSYGRGIVVERDCYEVSITHNMVVNATGSALILDSPDGCNVAFNTFENAVDMNNANAQQYGITLQRTRSTGDRKMKIHFNSFRNNTVEPIGSPAYFDIQELHSMSNNFEEGTLAYDGSNDGTRYRQVRRILHGDGTLPNLATNLLFQGDIIFNTEVETGGHIGLIATTDTGGPSQFVPFGQAGYRTNAGDPNTVLVPLRIGEMVLDTSNSDWYISVGSTNADWKQITA